VLAIWSHRPSRLSCLLGFGAALVLAGSTLALAPAPARASSGDHLYVIQDDGQFARSGTSYQISVYASSDSINPDYCFGDKVHFSYTDPRTALPADYTYTTDPLCTGFEDAGWHDFTLILIAAGSQTLTISDLSNPSIGSAVMNLNVAPGLPMSLAITGLPGTTTQGAASPFRVTVHDGFGNVDTDYSGTVGFTSTDGSATLPGSYTFNAGDAGTHLFTVTFGTTGYWAVEAYDAAYSLVTDAYTTVATADHFDIQIGDQSAGVYTSCSVIAKKANGDTDTAYTGTVAFTSSDPNAILPEDAADVPGQVTFTAGGYSCYTSDLMFYLAGAQTLTATDKSNPLITGTGSVNVSGGDSAKVSIVDFPTETFAGPVPFTVKMKDVYGNWGSDGHVSITSSDPKAILPDDYTFHPTDYGTHPFTITLETPGPQTVTVSGYEAGNNFSDTVSTTVLHGSATHLSVSGILNPYPSGSTHSVTVTALDSYGNPDPTYHGTVHFTSSDTKAVLPGDYTFTGADAGVHTFSVTLKTAGTQSVRARDTATATITGVQTGIVVTPGAAVSLIVSGIPSPYPAGSAHSVTVKALDAYGNVATGYRGTIHFNASDPAATVPANYTFTAADSGVHTFAYTLSPALVLRTAGTQAVRARDTVTSTITGVQTGIVVTPAAAKTLAVSGIPSPYVAGAAHSVTVKALDAYGNVATGYRGTIHFTTSDTKASVPANYTFTAADKGVHTFSYTPSPALVLRTVGTQSVRARDTVTATITGVQTGIVVE